MLKKVFVLIALVSLPAFGDDHLYSSAADPALLFSASFDNTVNGKSSRGQSTAAAIGNKSNFTSGIRDSALQIGYGKDKKDRGMVRFNAVKNMSTATGSIGFWIKPEDFAGSDRNFAIFFRAEKVGGGGILIYKYGANNLFFYTSEYKKTAIARYNINSWKAGEWHRIFCTWDDKVQKLYVDGELKNTIARQDKIQPEFAWFMVGANDWGDNEFGMSSIDELQIYDRAFTENEVQKDFMSSAPAALVKRQNMQISVGKSTPSTDGVIRDGEYKFSGGNFLLPGGEYANRDDRYYLSFDDKNFYVGVVSEQKTPPLANIQTRDGQTWLDDSIELWFNLDKNRVIQLIGNSKGTLTDIMHTDKSHDIYWDFQGLKTASQLRDGKWTMEYAIPLTELGLSGAINGRQFLFNIGRTYKTSSPGGFSCIAPVRRHRGFADVDNFAVLTLNDASPATDVASCGNINSGEIDFRAGVKSTAAINCRVKYETNDRIWYNNAITPVKNDNLQTFAAKHKNLTADGKLSVKIAGKNRILYQISYFARKKTPVSIQYIYTEIPRQKLIVVAKNESMMNGGHLLLRLTQHHGKKVFMEKKLPVSADKVIWKSELDIRDIAPGDYDFSGKYIDAQGESGETFEQYYRKSEAKPVWADNKIGLTPGKVPAPWVPVVRTNDVFECLTQKYGFKNSFLPSDFSVVGTQIFAAPAEIVIDGKRANNVSPFKMEKMAADQAVFTLAADAGDFSLKCRYTLDYDGMLWCDLRISPKNKQCNVTNIFIDIPLKKEFARQVHSNDGDTHKAKFGTTGLVPPQGWHKNLYNKPAFWVGNDFGGMAWYAEDLKNWRNADQNRSVELIPGAGFSTVRLRLIDKPGIVNGELRYQFGLHGTPVKKANNDVRGYRLNREWGWSDGSRYFNYLDAGEEFFDKKYLAAHKNLYKAKKADRFFLYIASNGASPYAPEWGYWGKIWTSRPIGDYIQETNIRTLAQRNKWIWTYSCLNSDSFRNFYLWQLDRVLRSAKWDIGNLYYDLVGPRMCDNAEHGCSWRDDRGQLHPTHNIRGGRDFHKRLYQLMKELRPKGLNLYHVTGQPVVPAVHSFADALVEGETFFGNDLIDKESYFGVLSPEMFRVGYYGQKWGTPTIFIPQLSRAASFYKPEKMQLWNTDRLTPAMRLAIEHFVGYMLVHDVNIWSANINVQKEHDRIWNRIKAFMPCWDGRVDFFPYWRDNGKFFHAASDSSRVLCSVYRYGDKAVFVVLNDTAEKRTLKISVTPEALLKQKSARVSDLSGREVPMDNNSWFGEVGAQGWNAWFVQ